MAKNIRESLAEILESIGLSKSEVQVFALLLESTEPMRATPLSRKLRINRTTLYGILKSLTEKGLVSSTDERGVLCFQSIQPELLIDYIERTKERLTKDAARMKTILPAIMSSRKSNPGYYPQIQFFDGVEGIKQVYEDTLRNNTLKMTHGFTDYQAVIECMGDDWTGYYIKKRGSLGIESYTVAPDSPKAREAKRRDTREHRMTKIFPPGYTFDIEIASYDDRTILVSFDTEHPLAVLIIDQKIADTMRSLFRYVDSTLSN